MPIRPLVRARNWVCAIPSKLRSRYGEGTRYVVAFYALSVVLAVLAAALKVRSTMHAISGAYVFLSSLGFLVWFGGGAAGVLPFAAQKRRALTESFYPLLGYVAFVAFILASMGDDLKFAGLLLPPYALVTFVVAGAIGLYDLVFLDGTEDAFTTTALAIGVMLCGINAIRLLQRLIGDYGPKVQAEVVHRCEIVVLIVFFFVLAAVAYFIRRGRLHPYKGFCWMTLVAGIFFAVIPLSVAPDLYLLLFDYHMLHLLGAAMALMALGLAGGVRAGVTPDTLLVRVLYGVYISGTAVALAFKGYPPLSEAVPPGARVLSPAAHVWWTFGYVVLVVVGTLRSAARRRDGGGRRPPDAD